MFKLNFKLFLLVCFAFLVAIISFSTLATAQSATVLINSNEWADVYSVSLFQSLKGESASFLTEDSVRDLSSFIPEEDSLVIYSSKSDPLVSSLKKDLSADDWIVDFEVKSDLLSIELDPLVKNYYILWDQQASLSLPLLSLAKKINSWVFIVSKDNVDDLTDYLTEKISNEGIVSDITLVGDLPLSIREKLDEFISDEINENSIQKTAEKLFKLRMNLESEKYSPSALLVTGRVIESDLFMSEQPILLVSDTFVSEDFVSLVQEYSLNSFSVVENSLFPFAQELKNELEYIGIENVSFFLKFGQSSLTQNGEVVSLSVFPLPEADIDLDITSVDYNVETSELLVYLVNKGESNAYVFASIDLIDFDFDNSNFENNYSYVDSVGSVEAKLIGPNEKNVLSFDIVLDVEEISDLKSKIFLAYGESKKQLDRHLISEETGLSPIYRDVEISSSEMEFIDLDVSQLIYRSDKDAFEIVIKNPETVELDAVLRVQSVLVDGLEQDFSSVVLIPSDRSVHLVHADLSSSDQESNQNISLEVQYKKSGEKYIRFLHVVDEFSVFTIIPLVLSALLTFLVISFFEHRRWSYRRKEKKAGIRWVKK